MRKSLLFSLMLLALPTWVAAKSPVVVELYTAQGCAGCPEANANLAKLAEKPGVLALTFPVDYWDYLGWPDTFAKPEFTERQKTYVARLSLREPYTPQVVVDGRGQAPGLKVAAIQKLVSDAARASHDAPDIRLAGGRVYVGSGHVPRGGAEVWLIRYEPREQDVVVKSGDNKGQTVVHRNLVREVRRLGAWRGRSVAFRLGAPAEEGLETVVIVQGARGGRILGVGRPRA